MCNVMCIGTFNVQTNGDFLWQVDKDKDDPEFSTPSAQQSRTDSDIVEELLAKLEAKTEAGNQPSQDLEEPESCSKTTEDAIVNSVQHTSGQHSSWRVAVDSGDINDSKNQPIVEEKAASPTTIVP